MPNTNPVNFEIQKRNTIPQLAPNLPTLAEEYAKSQEEFLACSNNPMLCFADDYEPFMEKVRIWANMVVYAAALREQAFIARKTREEQEEREARELELQQNELEDHHSQSEVRELSTH